MNEGEKLFLIVDDEPDMCWILENVLAQNGYAVKKALSGREAVELVNSHNFYMAFIDLKLDDMEGIELAQMLRDIDSSLKIVMISGFCYKDEPTVQRALAEELICDFIPKPFLHNDIKQAIHNSQPSRKNCTSE